MPSTCTVCTGTACGAEADIETPLVRRYQPSFKEQDGDDEPEPDIDERIAAAVKEARKQLQLDYGTRIATAVRDVKTAMRMEFAGLLKSTTEDVSADAKVAMKAESQARHTLETKLIQKMEKIGCKVSASEAVTKLQGTVKELEKQQESVRM